jgi:Family of unknown function (DUF5763)
MERSVRVNAFADAGRPKEGFQIHPTGEFPLGPSQQDGSEVAPGEGVTGEEFPGEEINALRQRRAISSAPRGDQGPCLYLGPGGQRCDRRATRDGFCSKHLPGAIGEKIATPSKKVIAALLAISGLLWPLLADIVRELLRWIHSHQ